MDGSAQSNTLSVRALLLGERIDTRGLERDGTIATNPLTLLIGTGGFACLFRHGVAVFAGLSAVEEHEIIRWLGPRIKDPAQSPETDQVQIVVKPGGEDEIESSGVIAVREVTPERLQIVADVLSKSLILSHYEARIADAFDQIEPLAERLRRTGRAALEARRLLRQIGNVLLTQQRMVGRAELGEKPDVLWDHPELERLDARLADEYELTERGRALERKLALIDKTIGTLLDLVQDQRSVRLEWYVIGLIGLEIVVSLGNMMLHGPCRPSG